MLAGFERYASCLCRRVPQRTNRSILDAAVVLNCQPSTYRHHIATVDCNRQLRNASTSFFSYTSGRARRRRAREEHRRKLRERMLGNRPYLIATDTEPKIRRLLLRAPEADTRTIVDILFPNPFKHHPRDPSEQLNWPKTWSGWMHLHRQVWQQYKGTWDGFWTSRGLLVQSEAEQEEERRLQEEENEKRNGKLTIVDNKVAVHEKIATNLRKNAKFFQDESFHLRNSVQTATGIRNTQDIKDFFAEMLKLFSECLQEFMNGYRKGRNDETEKIVATYVQGLKEEFQKRIMKDSEISNDTEQKKRRRKRKRRTIDEL
jgi:hypothetical protein